MTREKEILNEVYYQNHLADIDGESFIRGAKWADENPQSPWISVEDDLPCNHEELIDNEDIEQFNTTSYVYVTCEDGYYSVDYMISTDEDKWEWASGCNWDYWMPKPPLPKRIEN